MINNTLKNDCYITIPRIKKFCNENGIGTINLREEGLNEIEKFAKQCDANKDKVNEWLDAIAKEGIKYSCIRRISEDTGLYKNIEFWQQFKCKEFENREMTRVNESMYNEELKIQFIETITDDDKVIKVRFNLGLLVYELKGIVENTIKNKIVYPIFVELDTVKNFFEIRLKSKSKIYMIELDKITNEEKVGFKITIQKMMKYVIDFLNTKINFKEEDIGISKKILFSAYYNLLDSLTQTPQAVLNKVLSMKCEVSTVINDIFSKLGLNILYKSSAAEDLNFWLEKFISLSEHDKSIFIDQSNGYPVRLIATDSDETRLEQASADKQPLQTKPSFFDHKKILKKEKLCDGMTLAFKRKDELYYGKDPFLVVLFYEKGFGVIKFPEYVEEGDIQNVLSRIIESF